MSRWLHPGAWWLWALGLATAASRTTNPLLLLLIVAVAGHVVAARRPDAPWARSFGFFLRLGVVVVVVRVAFQVVLGAPVGATVLLPLPTVPLPEWLSGLRVGGDLTAEALLLALYDGMRLATIIACLGAASSLASPSRLLKSLPAALYEVGVAVVVALTFAPQLVTDVQRVRTARRLRGRPTRGVRGVAGAAMPVLEGALERSVTLAAAMDSRGYGRSAAVPAARRRLVAGLVLGGLVAACVGAYGLLDAGSPPALGLPALVLGVLAAAVGGLLAGRRTVRSRYRPDPWLAPEWGVAASGLVAAGTFLATAALGLPGLTAPVDPPGWPPLPILPLVGVLVALLPSVLAPPVPRPAAVAHDRPLARRAPRRRCPRRGGRHMIRFEHVTITYPGAAAPVLRDVHLHVPEGELALVVGCTGSGKSTLLRAVNGLVPHFSGGTLAGQVLVAGRDTRTHPPRELADVVGVVPQDPMAGFVTDLVEDELAYGMECLAWPPP